MLVQCDVYNIYGWPLVVDTGQYFKKSPKLSHFSKYEEVTWLRTHIPFGCSISYDVVAFLFSDYPKWERRWGMGVARGCPGTLRSKGDNITLTPTLTLSCRTGVRTVNNLIKRLQQLLLYCCSHIFPSTTISVICVIFHDMTCIVATCFDFTLWITCLQTVEVDVNFTSRSAVWRVSTCYILQGVHLLTCYGSTISL